MRAITATFAVLLMLGCQPPTPEEVAAQTATDVDELLTGAVETARATNNWASIDTTYAMGSRAGTVTTRPTIPADTSSDQMMRYLRYYAERIFTEKNAVPGSGGNVFAVRGDIVCTSPDSPNLAPDPLCVRRIDDAQLRIKVTPGIDLTLQVGPNHLEPGIIHLRSGKSISYEVDLEQSQKASAFLVSAAGGSPTAFTFDAKGRYEMKLEKNGTNDYSVSMSVLEDIVFAVIDDRGVRRAFSTERRSPLISLRVDAMNRRATFGLDVGKTTYDGAGSDIWNASDIGPMHGELAGLTAQLTFEDGKPEQKLTGLGLGNGTSFIAYSGNTVLSVDLNEQTGRKLDLTMRNTVSGATAFDISPSLELSTGFWFAALPYESTSTDPAFANARYTFAWKGAGPNVTGEWTRPDSFAREALKLVAGGFALQSNRTSDLSRQFAQGSCIAPRTTSTVNPHPILDLFESVPCR